jgi:hypothetical protein
LAEEIQEHLGDSVDPDTLQPFLSDVWSTPTNKISDPYYTIEYESTPQNS